VIDLHSHVLPGLDDGCVDISQTVELVRSLADAGVRTVAATPHVRSDYPTTVASMQQALAATRAAVSEAGIECEIVAGAEIALDWVDRLGNLELEAFSLGGKGGYVLVECPYDDFPASLGETVLKLGENGFTAILAHPERNAFVQGGPQRLAGLVDLGALIQVTAGSLSGAFGPAPAKAGRSLVDSGLAHVVASDAHRPGSRPAMRDAVRELPDALATWLTQDVPRAILQHERPPPRPQGRRRRAFFSR
jgi:protein-tyrosine phosphatase